MRRVLGVARGVSHAVTAQGGGKLSEDVAVPIDRLAEAIDETVAIGDRHGLTACSWGHAGDGNLHSTFLLTPGDEDQLRRAGEAAEELFAMAIRLGGTVSGEHGVGLLKNGQLSTAVGRPPRWSCTARSSTRSTRRGSEPREETALALLGASEAADRDLGADARRCSRKMRKYASSSFVRSGGSIASRSASNSASEIAPRSASLSTSRAPLPSPNWAFSRHSRSSGSQPSNASRRSFFSGRPARRASPPAAAAAPSG